MKTLTPKVLVALFVVSALFVGGCDKTTDPAGSGDKPTFPSFQISTPSASAINDTCNLKAYIYALTAQVFVQSSAAFNALPAQNVNGVWTWTFTEDGVTETLTAQKQADGSFSWRLALNGTDTNDGTTYSNWTAMSGTSSADGNTGSMTIYDDSPSPSTQIAMQVSWRQVAGGVEITIDEYSSGQPETRAVVVSNTNGSGSVAEFTRSGSAWVSTGFNATWSAPDAVAVCG